MPFGRVLTLTLFSVLAACSTGSSAGSTDPCPTTSKCPGDKVDPTTCRAALADTKCGDEYKLYVTCATANQTCDSSGRTCTAGLLTACASQWTDYYRCATNEWPDAAVDVAVCDGGGD